MPKTKNVKIIIKADGNKWIGMGHLYRNAYLLEELRRYAGVDAMFLTRVNVSANKFLSARGFSFVNIPNGHSRESEVDIMRGLIVSFRPDAVIVDDLNYAFDRSCLVGFNAEQRPKLIVFDDRTEQIYVDADEVFLFNPNRVQPGKNKNTSYHVGLKYFISASCYKKATSIKIRQNVTNIAVCMGGSDRRNLTLLVLRALAKLRKRINIRVALSSNYHNKDKISAVSAKLGLHVDLFVDEKNLCDFFNGSDLAITSGGNAHLERMILGLPGGAICQSKREDQIVEILCKMKATKQLGKYNTVRSKSLFADIDSLISNYRLRKQMSLAGKRVCDAYGAKRISKIIMKSISH